MRLLRVIARLFTTPPRRHSQRRDRPQQPSAPKAPVASVWTIPAAAVVPAQPRPLNPVVEPEPEAALVGRCYVIDGDTIDISGLRIRLAGIDAPELDHPFGNSAKWALVRMCKGLEIRAVFDGSKSHDRTVATCFLPDGRDLSEEMVKAGLAIDWPKFSGGRYRPFEPDGVRKKLWRCDARQRGKLPPKPWGAC
ncbi:MAG: thermonuclease family protein [Paracoccaceae bacterium]